MEDNVEEDNIAEMKWRRMILGKRNILLNEDWEKEKIENEKKMEINLKYINNFKLIN
jgi:hypothetical protein